MNDIMQRNCLINGAQLVETISPQRANAQAEVDLGKRAGSNLLGMLI